MSKTRRIFRALGLLSLLVGAAVALGACSGGPEPLIGLDFWRAPGAAAAGEKLAVRIEDVDDIADVWVINDVAFRTGYFQPALRAQWEAVDGRAQGDLTRHLDPGINYITFTLFNRKYKGPSIHETGGKYRCDFRLYLDGELLYKKTLYEQYNQEKLIFAAVFKVRLEDDRLRTEVLTPEEKVRLTEVIRGGLADMLHDSAETAEVNWRTLTYRAVTSDPEVKRAMEELRRLQQGD